MSRAKKAEAAKAVVESTTKKTTVVKETTKEKPTTTKKPTAAEEKASGRNSYGHLITAQSGQLDELLERGMSVADMAKAIGSSEGRVKSHVKHLREDLKITVSEGKDGVFKIAK